MRIFESPYGNQAFQGATIVPRLLFFVEVSQAPAALVSGICNIEPQRSSFEKSPWKDLSSDAIHPLSGAIEDKHIYSIHRGETVAPFMLLPPNKVVLPMEHRWQGVEFSNDPDNINGVDIRTLGMRMRDRWRAMCDLWDENKQPNNKLTLLERIDYHKALSHQTQREPVRLLYTTSGTPTAAVLEDLNILIDSTLYWIECRSLEEAYYLSAIINSNALSKEVRALMPKGAFGARHLHKQLWRLPIPEYDKTEPIHAELSSLGKHLHSQAQIRWAKVRKGRLALGKTTSVKVARRVLREWLTTNPEAQRAELLVEQLINYK